MISHDPLVCDVEIDLVLFERLTSDRCAIKNISVFDFCNEIAD